MGPKSKLLYWYLFLLAVYSCFTLLPKPSPATLLRYSVSTGTLRLIYLTIIVLLAAIWYAGFYGYAKLQEYTRHIKDEKDGKQVAKLTKGIGVLVMWLPVSFVISAILNFIASHHLNLGPAVAIIDNYISLLFPLIGFLYIGLGGRGLSELVKRRPSHLATNVIAILLIYVGIIYYRLVATTANRTLVYHMNIWLIALTLIAPYIYMWFIGFLATYEIYNYRKNVAGVVYRRSWGLLGFGLGWLILCSIGVQYLTSLTARLQHLSIYGVLGIIYALLLVYSVGFILIALGARKLQRIEEV